MRFKFWNLRLIVRARRILWLGPYLDRNLTGVLSAPNPHRSAYFCCVKELVPVDPAGAKVPPVSTGSADTRSAVMFTGVAGRLYPSDQEPPLSTDTAAEVGATPPVDPEGLAADANVGAKKETV